MEAVEETKVRSGLQQSDLFLLERERKLTMTATIIWSTNIDQDKQFLIEMMI